MAGEAAHEIKRESADRNHPHRLSSRPMPEFSGGVFRKARGPERFQSRASSRTRVARSGISMEHERRKVRRGTLSRGVVRVGRERGLRPGPREPRAWEAKANSGVRFLADL